MRRILVVVLLAAGLAACGSSPATKGGGGGGGPARVEFGTTGGNIQPQKRTVSVGGNLASRLRSVFGDLVSRRCPGTLPDVASEYIRFEGRTVTVHGSCESRFTRLWNELEAAGSGSSG